MKIITIGGSGLVGSRVVDILTPMYSIENAGTSTGVDITVPASLEKIKNDREAEVVILFAAKTNVDGCEIDRPQGIDGDAWKINVIGVQNVVNACKATNKKLIYISTDFVFDGSARQTSADGEGYVETDIPNPINWYGQTKYAGEEIVKNSELPYIVARIAYPYRAGIFEKLDFARAIKDRLVNAQNVSGVTDHIFTPTYIDDIAIGISMLIETKSTGMFHLTGSQSLSPYDAAVKIAKKLGFSESVITKTTRAKYFVGKAPRPFNVSMNNDKISNLGVKMFSFEEGLEEMSKI